MLRPLRCRMARRQLARRARSQALLSSAACSTHSSSSGVPHSAGLVMPAIWDVTSDMPVLTTPDCSKVCPTIGWAPMQVGCTAISTAVRAPSRRQWRWRPRSAAGAFVQHTAAALGCSAAARRCTLCASHGPPGLAAHGAKTQSSHTQGCVAADGRRRLQRPKLGVNNIYSGSTIGSRRSVEGNMGQGS
jgi:hypothetical protein